MKGHGIKVKDLAKLFGILAKKNPETYVYVDGIVDSDDDQIAIAGIILHQDPNEKTGVSIIIEICDMDDYDENEYELGDAIGLQEGTYSKNLLDVADLEHATWQDLIPAQSVETERAKTLDLITDEIWKRIAQRIEEKFNELNSQNTARKAPRKKS